MKNLNRYTLSMMKQKVTMNIEGWGTALKPAMNMVMARKPLEGTNIEQCVEVWNWWYQY